MYIWFGAAPCECQHPRSSKPEGYELIKEEHNRRGKTGGGNQIEGRGGLARDAKYFLLFLEFGLKHLGRKRTWQSGALSRGQWERQMKRSSVEQNWFGSYFRPHLHQMTPHHPHPHFYVFCLLLSVFVCLSVSSQFSPRSCPCPGPGARIWWAASHCFFYKHSFLEGQHTCINSSTSGCSVRSPLNRCQSLCSSKSPIRRCLGRSDSAGLSKRVPDRTRAVPGPPWSIRILLSPLVSPGLTLYTQWAITVQTAKTSGHNKYPLIFAFAAKGKLFGWSL